MVLRLNIRRNAALAVAEVCAASAGLLVLYRTVLDHLSLGEMGIWSLVAAATVMARVGDLGVTAGVTRFVARSRALNQDGATEIVETAILVVAGLSGAVACAAWVPLASVLPWLIGRADLDEAQSILPLALTAFVVGNINAVALSALTGLHLAYVRSCIAITGTAVLLLSAVVLVPIAGLEGLVGAQILQACFVLAVGWVALRRIMPGLSPVPARVSRPALRQLLGYGLRLQAGAIASLVFDPAVKTVLVAEAGLESLALYEMASRIVLQARGLLVAANHTLVASYADLHERSKAELLSLYSRNVRHVSRLACWGALIVLTGFPPIALLLFGRPEPTFLAYSAILLVGWGLSALAAPIYFLALGTGHPGYVALNHLAAAAAAPLLAYFLAKPFGGVGVVVGAMVALNLGTFILWRAHVALAAPLSSDPAPARAGRSAVYG